MKVFKAIEREYYKYESSSFVQPTLSANGTMGGDAFAVEQSSTLSSYYAYKMFDDNSSTEAVADYNDAYFAFYNPEPLNVTAIAITNESDSRRAIQTCKVSVSNDGTTYIDIYTYTGGSTGSETWTIDLSSNTGHYKYYRVTALTTGGYPYGIIQVNITATYLVAVPATEADYDFYEDKDVYKAVLKEEEDMSNQWVASHLAVYNGAIDGTGNPHVYNWSTNIASYLPNDGQQYEILCEEYASGTVNVRIDTDFASDLSAFYNSGTNAEVRNTVLVIGAGRILQLRSYNSTSTYWLTFIAYRKVGSTTYSALNI